MASRASRRVRGGERERGRNTRPVRERERAQRIVMAWLAEGLVGGMVGGAGRGLGCAHDDASSSLLRNHVTLVAPPE